MYRIPNEYKGAINILGCIVVIGVNILINLLLSPYIVRHIGVEANGFITLANNFISYISLITIALDSTAGRNVYLETHRNNTLDANKYYTSVLCGDWFISIILGLPMLIFLTNIELFLNISYEMISTVRVLFAITFFNFFLALCCPKWSMATYITNNLYLRSLKTVISSLTRGVLIFVFCMWFTPNVCYVAIAGTAMTGINLIFEYNFKRRLTPQLEIRLQYFDFEKIRILLFAGIWNSITKCGALLFDGIDLLLANLFISPVAMGMMSIAKIIPNMINQLAGTVTTTFGPNLIRLFAEDRLDDLRDAVHRDIRIVGGLISVPIGIAFSLGECFFGLWMPTQNSTNLLHLMMLSSIGILFSSLTLSVSNIFVVTNKLKFNSVIILISGFINIITVYLLLKTTNLGIWAILISGTSISVLRCLVFTLPYAAHCINQKKMTFIPTTIVSAMSILVPYLCGMVTRYIFAPETWIGFIGSVTVSATPAFILVCCLLSTQSERKLLLTYLSSKSNLEKTK